MNQVRALTDLSPKAFIRAIRLSAGRAAPGLQTLNAMEIVPSTTNFILCHLRPDGPDAATVIERCEADGLFLRNASTMGTQPGSHALRIAVKDRETNCRMVEILTHVLCGEERGVTG